MNRPLAEFAAEFTRHTDGGETTDAILMGCPICGTPPRSPEHPDAHYVVIPYTDAPLHRNDRNMPVWHREGGTFEGGDLTLSPSYALTSGCMLHGFVRAGRWEAC